jgi:hypothetical protein
MTSIYFFKIKRYNQYQDNSIEVLILKKSISLLLALVLTFSATFVACSSNTADTDSDTSTTADPDGLQSNEDSYIFDEVEVTDENGETVTDENGTPVTTEVIYRQETDKKGNTYAVLVDENGEDVTDSKGKAVTKKVTTTKATTTESETMAPTTSTTKGTTTTMKAGSGTATTNKELTTISASKDKVPSTSDNGTSVKFSSDDQQTIKSMLEVPYLYKANYENSNGVPTNIAAHAAIWMAQREGLNTTTYASGTIVLDLFKFFGQTVVNFKTKCNSEKDKDCVISYNSTRDTFSISAFESHKQTVSITDIQDLGNNNYYKVTATVSGAGSISKVVAIVQRNKLDSTLGFSIKALKWS